MTNMKLEDYIIFSQLDQDLINRIKFVHIFDNSKNAIIVTTLDEVYILGDNDEQYLNFTSGRNPMQACFVPELSYKEMKEFAFGTGPHILALNEQGQVYGWGNNAHGQAGIVSENAVLSPAMIPSLSSKQIIQVACGSLHSLALCSDGKVYSWGCNANGQTGRESVFTIVNYPDEVRGPLREKRVVEICCNGSGSVALTEDGEIFRWGNLTPDHQYVTPLRISTLSNIVITKIACGEGHILALSEEGVVFAWGCNKWGQLGIGSKSDSEEPTRISSFEERIIDIAASHFSNTSAAMSETLKVYMWGSCRGPCIVKPLLTRCVSLHEVFLNHSNPIITYKAWKPINRMTSSVTESLRNAFDNPQCSDLTISVDGDPIRVHKSILRIRSDYFRKMFQDHWCENNQKELKIDKRNYKIYRAFLKYLYTDEIDLPPEDVLELYLLANEFCIESLKDACEQSFKHNMNVQNCITLCVAAMRFQAKGLENFCLTYISNHMNEAFRTSAFAQLDSDTLKKLMLELYQSSNSSDAKLSSN